MMNHNQSTKKEAPHSLSTFDDSSDNSCSYTVVGTICQATNQQPWITFAEKPPCLSKKQWEDLKNDLFENYYIHKKLFGTLLMIGMFCLGLLLMFITTYLNLLPKEKNAVWFLGLFWSYPILIEALVGYCWRISNVRNVVEHKLKPRLRQQGSEINFETRGKVFFIVGILTIRRSPYDPITIYDK